MNIARFYNFSALDFVLACPISVFCHSKEGAFAKEHEDQEANDPQQAASPPDCDRHRVSKLVKSDGEADIREPDKADDPSNEGRMTMDADGLGLINDSAEDDDNSAGKRDVSRQLQNVLDVFRNCLAVHCDGFMVSTDAYRPTALELKA